MLKIFNEFVDVVKKEGMIYFKDNTDELKAWINKLEFLNNVKSASQCKIMYYTLMELLETVVEEREKDNVDMDIYSIERKFLDYIDIVRESITG